MANERIIAELIIEGAQRSVRQIVSVETATTSLLQVQESVGVRQRQIYDSVAKAAEESARKQEEAAKAAEAAARRSANAAATAATRQRDPSGRFISRDAERQREATRAREAISSGLADDPIRLKVAIDAASFTAARKAIEAEQRRIQEGLAQQGQSLSRFKLLSDEQLQSRNSAAQFTAARNAMVQQQAAAQTLQGRLLALGTTIARVATETVQFITASRGASQALDQQAEATGRAHRSGVTYLSVLSAIHAASFLATNRTFTLLGSFVTLGLAFTKAGVAAAGVGIALGGLLAVFGQISRGIELVNAAITGTAATLVKAGAVGTAALVGLGAASVKIAADFETQLASVRAFGGATTEQLEIIEKQAGVLAKQYGVSAANIVEATSLFARAGGTVEEAIQGATEAIVKLTVASQGEIQAAQAAILLSAAMRQFALDGAQAVRVVDNLTAAAQGSALSFLGVQQAFIQAAPGARTLGITLEDTAAAIALLGNELVKGTITGTAFKQFLLDIIKPSAKAQEEFAKYGIAIEDTDGKIRPLIDILDDLNKALGDQAVASGQVTEAARARALAIIFESRAGLAANILTREGAEGLQRFRNELAETTASGIVSVLMLPLNKQLEVLKVSVEELGRAFGGPLLQPIREATVAAIRFVQGIEPQIELLGQAISVILTGQGFGQLQTKIAEMAGDTALASFLIELVNSFRNVRDVIVTQIVPAIQEFISIVGQTSNEAGRLDDIGDRFQELNRKIQNIGAATAGAIVGLANLIREFVNAEGGGGRLRETIEGLGRSFITQLSAGITLTIASIRAAIIVMPIMARMALVVAQAVLSLAGALKELGLQNLNFVRAGAVFQLGLEALKPENIFDVEKQAQIKRAQQEVNKQAEELGRELAKDSAEAQKLAAQIPIILSDLDKLGKGFDNFGAASAENARIARTSMEQLVTELQAEAALAAGIDPLEAVWSESQLREFIQRAGAMKAAAVAQVNPMLQVFEDLQGQISTSLANITAEIEQSQREAEARGTATTGVIPGTDDDTIKAIERAQARIRELANDTARRVQNAMEDAQQQTTNTINRSLERLDDVFVKANEQLAKLARDTRDRVAEIFENIDQRRSDRGRTDVVKKQLDDELKIYEEALEKQERALQRSQDIIRLLRQHEQEDQEESLKRIVELEEQRYKDLQENASQAFKVAQEAADRALKATQDAEEKALRKTLDAQAQARKDQQELAEAKTPEERAQVLRRQAQARSDRAFSEGQEAQLDALRKRHEDAQAKQQRGNELAQAAFRKNQETAFDNLRRNNELAFRKIRREQEAAELVRRFQEEDKELARRKLNEEKLTAFRELQALRLRKFQDQLEDEAAIRQANKVIQQALERASEIEADSLRAAGEIFDQLELQLAEQEAQLERTLRNIKQAFDDFADSLPAEIKPSVIGQLNAAMAQLEERSQATRDELQRARANVQLRLDQQRAVSQAELQLRVPSRQQFEQQIPTRVGQVSTQLQVAQVLLPPGFNTAVAQAVRLGIVQAVESGVLPDSVNIRGLEQLAEPLRGLQRFFR